MSAQPLSYADQLEETERLKKLGNEICADISEILEQRGEIALRYAILGVLLDGDPRGDPFNVNGETGDTVSGWSFDMPDTPLENERRGRFCDAVIARLREERRL